MIGTFQDKVLKALWERGRVKGIDAKSQARLVELLGALDAATKPEDMDLPGYGFHGLKGNRKNQFAVEIRGNFRLVFEWEAGEAVRVRQEDYHGD